MNEADALRPYLADARRPGARDRHAGRAGARDAARRRWRMRSSPISQEAEPSTAAADATASSRRRRDGCRRAARRVQPASPARLRDPRNAGALARSRAAGLRAARHRVPDAGLRLRHQHGCRSRLPSPCSTATSTPESRAYLEGLRGSRYFAERAPIAATLPMERRLAQRRAAGSRSRFRRGSAATCGAAGPTEVGGWIDGAMPFRAETSRGYVAGVHRAIPRRAGARAERAVPPPPPATIEIRFRYNQDFDSVNAMVPSTHRDAAGADPGDPDGARRGAREGAGLDHQPLRDAGARGSSSSSASSCPTSSWPWSISSSSPRWRCSSSACR